MEAVGTWAALNTILGKVSQATGVSRELIIGGRNRRVAFVRSMFYYVARQEKYTCSLIGRAIGHRGAIVSTQSRKFGSLLEAGDRVSREYYERYKAIR